MMPAKERHTTKASYDTVSGKPIIKVEGDAISCFVLSVIKVMQTPKREASKVLQNSRKRLA